MNGYCNFLCSKEGFRLCIKKVKFVGLFVAVLPSEPRVRGARATCGSVYVM
jgi:hypothetical protein